MILTQKIEINFLVGQNNTAKSDSTSFCLVRPFTKLFAQSIYDVNRNLKRWNL